MFGEKYTWLWRHIRQVRYGLALPTHGGSAGWCHGLQGLGFQVLPYRVNPLTEGTVWRLLPMVDPLVDVMVSRDLDSRYCPIGWILWLQVWFGASYPWWIRWLTTWSPAIWIPGTAPRVDPLTAGMVSLPIADPLVDIMVSMDLDSRYCPIGWILWPQVWFGKLMTRGYQKCFGTFCPFVDSLASYRQCVQC